MAPKRKRYTECAHRPKLPSPSKSPDEAVVLEWRPLTKENLQLSRKERGELERQKLEEPGMPAKAASVASKTTTFNNQRIRLHRANIHFTINTPIPQALQHHISNLLTPRTAPSPRAEEVASRAYEARQGSEMTSHARFASIMLLNTGEEKGHEWLTRRKDVQFDSAFNPQIVSKIAQADGDTTIVQAQPDTCIGYIPSDHSNARMSKPFTKIQEETIEARYAF
jgi:hypothetical protein